MPTTDPRVDAYIAKSPDFARPILARIREMVHAACPRVEEKIKWSAPFFDYEGQMMCGMAAFKQHCSLIFWKAPLIEGLPDDGDPSRGSFGRIISVKELPSKSEFTGFIKAAMALNEAGTKGAEGARGRAREEQEGRHRVRELSAGASSRILRMDRRGEARRDEGEACDAGRRMDRRRKIAKLEVLTREDRRACDSGSG
jgi:hypothetical protein